MAQPGSVPEWGSGGRGFKSHRSDREFFGLNKKWEYREKHLRISTKYSIIIFFLFLFSSSISLAQSVNVGFRVESIAYFYKNTINNTNHVWLSLAPFSGYLRLSVSYDKYELELKGGGQLGEVFAGPEYALELKYNIDWKNIYPLIVYLKSL